MIFGHNFDDQDTLVHVVGVVSRGKNMRKIKLLLIFLAFSTPKLQVAWAGVPHIDKITVQTQHSKQVTFSILGSSLPSFQIYPFQQDHQFALDLPGIDLSQLPTPTIGEHPLLNDIILETTRGRHFKSPRVILAFNQAVQYEIKSDTHALHFIFTYAGTNRNFKKQSIQNQKEDEQTKKYLRLKQQQQLLQQKVEKMTTTLKALKDNFKTEALRQKKEKTTFQEKLQNQRQEHHDLKLKIAQQQILIRTLNEETLELKKIRQQYHSEVSTEKRTRNALREDIKSAQKDSLALQNLLNAQKAQHGNIKKSIAVLNEQQSILEKSHNQTNILLEQQKQRVAEEQKKRNELREEIASLQQTKEKSQGTIAQILEKQNQAQTQLDNVTHEISALQSEKIEAFKRLTQIIEDQDNATATLQKTQKDIFALGEEKKKQQNELVSLVQKQDEAKTTLSSFQVGQKNLQHLEKKKDQLEQEIIAKKAIQQKRDQQLQADESKKILEHKQKSLRLQQENIKLQKQIANLRDLTQLEKRNYKKQLVQNEQAQLDMKEAITSHETSVKILLDEVKTAKHDLTELHAKKQSIQQELKSQKIEYAKRAELNKVSQQNSFAENERIVKNHQQNMQQLENQKELLHAKVEQQKEQLQFYILKNEKEQDKWTKSSEARLTKEKEKIEALRLTQRKLKEQITQDLIKQEKEYLEETRSQKKIQEDKINQLKQEKQALLNEIRIHKKQKQEIKEQARKEIFEINEEHLNTQEEKNKKISLLTNQKKNLDDQLSEHLQTQHQNKIVIENQNQKMASLRKQNTALKEQKDDAFKRLAIFKSEISKKQNVKDAPIKPQVVLKKSNTETMPLVTNRYWQIPAEKIDRTKFGGDGEVRTKEPGRGVLNRLMVVRNKGNTGSKVGLRIDGGARFTITQQSPTSYLVKLFDTRAGNLKVRRILDASDINTTVLRLLPHVEEEQHHRISLRIELRKPTRIQTAQDGTLLWLRFDDT